MSSNEIFSDQSNLILALFYIPLLPLITMRTLKILSISFIAMTTACVSASKHQELEAENAKNLAALADAESRVSALNAKLGISDTKRSELESSVTEMQRALEELKKRKAEAEKRLADFKELTSKFSKLISSGKLNVKMVNGRMTVALSTDILFSSGSAKLSPAGIAAIQEVTQVLTDLEGRQYQIEGHTDNVPIKKTELYPSNWELASARAMSVVKTMLDAGMPATRISGAAYADSQPSVSNKTPEGRAQNRRIAIVIVPDLSGLPGNEELEKLVAGTEGS